MRSVYVIRTTVSQWPNGYRPDCGVRGPRFEYHRGQLFITTATVIYNLGQGLHTITAVSSRGHLDVIRPI